MRQNILNKTFIILAMATFGLTSCKQNGSLDNDVTKPEVTGEAATTQNPIEAIIAKIRAEQNIITNNADPTDQYGLKTNLFAKLENTENTKKYSEDENQNLRKQFYASLNSDKKTIEDFGAIVVKIEQDMTNRGTWHKDLIDTGYKIQDGLENLINQIDPKKDKLNTLTAEKMTELQTKFDEIATLKTNWIKFVQEVIKDHTDNTNSIQTNGANLVDLINTKFNSTIKTQFDNIEQIKTDVKAITDTIN